MGNSTINTTTYTIDTETGMYFYASRSLLRKWNLPDTGQTQYQLVEWLKQQNQGLFDVDNYFLIGSTIITPKEKDDILSIITVQTPEVTSTEVLIQTLQRNLTPDERELHRSASEALALSTPGIIAGSVNYDAITVIKRMPTKEEIIAAIEEIGIDKQNFIQECVVSGLIPPSQNIPTADSLLQTYLASGIIAWSSPSNGNIYIPNNTHISIIVHEIEHQAQYQRSADIKATYKDLIKEGLQYIRFYQGDHRFDNPYTTQGQGYLEYAAREVEKKANDLLSSGWQANTGGSNP